MKIENVNISSGMQEEPIHGRSINEVQIRGRSKPYFQGIEKKPLEFSVSFAFVEPWNDELLRKVVRWLTEQEYYKPLIFSNNLEKIYYAMAVDDPVLVHNCLKEGYLSINFRCNDAYAYSPVHTSKLYDWDEIPVTINENDFSKGVKNRVILDNNGDITLKSTRPKWSDFSSSMRWSEV